MSTPRTKDHGFRIPTAAFRVEPGTEVDLSRFSTQRPAEFDGRKDESDAALEPLALRLAELQQLLYAHHEHRILLVLQGMDTSGKDGTVRKVFREVGPIGVDIANFKAPNDEELAHDYLWRIHHHSPRVGHITVFNRSHYEDVLIVRVHDLAPRDRIEKRYGHINDFERMLTDEGVTIVKCFLHLSPEEQRQRLQARLDDPRKQWKFNHGDLDERKRWGEYQEAYEIMLSRTSTEWAPWHVIPADQKWFRNLAVAQLLTETVEALGMRWPDLDGKLAQITVE
jgi:PPK2 family polyphosphate:nucleotide phosphotransferase